MTEKEKKKNVVNIVLAVVGVISIIWIIYLKNSRPEDSILLPLIIIGAVMVFFVISYFGKSITKMAKQLTHATKEKKTLTEKEVLNIVYRIVEGTSENEFNDGMFRNIKRIEPRRSREVNGNEICAIKVRLSYPISFNGKQEDGLWIIVNATYPSITPSILSEDAEKTERLSEEITFKSKNYKDPTVTEETVQNDSLGYLSKKKTTAPNPEEKEEEKKEDEL